MDLAMAYGQRPKFFRAEHSATAKGENCVCGPTLIKGFKLYNQPIFKKSVPFGLEYVQNIFSCSLKKISHQRKMR